MPAIGVLQVDPNYLSVGEWPDSDNLRVPFQYDPEKISYSLKADWKPDESVVGGTLTRSWRYEKSSEPQELKIPILFDDAVKDSASQISANNALVALERLALPLVADIWRQSQQIRVYMGSVVRSRGVAMINVLGNVLDATWVRAVTIDPEIRGQTDVAIINRLYAFIEPSTESRRSYQVITYRPAGEQVTAFGQQILRREISVRNWHPPRPLLLRLHRSPDWPCIIKEMSISVLKMDSVTGTPTAIQAEVTLKESDYPGRFSADLPAQEWHAESDGRQRPFFRLSEAIEWNNPIYQERITREFETIREEHWPEGRVVQDYPRPMTHTILPQMISVL